MTQKEAVKQHLLDYNHITPLDALREYGAFRLSHIILILRKSGMKIETLRTTHISKYGNKSYYANYKLNN